MNDILLIADCHLGGALNHNPVLGATIMSRIDKRPTGLTTIRFAWNRSPMPPIDKIEPDYFLALPWRFEGIYFDEQKFISRRGKMNFSFPNIGMM